MRFTLNMWAKEGERVCELVFVVKSSPFHWKRTYKLCMISIFHCMHGARRILGVPCTPPVFAIVPEFVCAERSPSPKIFRQAGNIALYQLNRSLDHLLIDVSKPTTTTTTMMMKYHFDCLSALTHTYKRGSTRWAVSLLVVSNVNVDGRSCFKYSPLN